MKSHLRYEREREEKERETREDNDKDKGKEAGSVEVEMETEEGAGSEGGVEGGLGGGGESRKDDVAQNVAKDPESELEVVGHGFESLEDFETIPVPVGSQGHGEGMGMGMGMLGLDMDVLESLTYPPSSCPSSSTSGPASATTEASGYFSFDWSQATGDAGITNTNTNTASGSRDAVELAGVGSFASLPLPFVNCDGLDLSELVGPSLLMPERLEAEMRAFIAGGGSGSMLTTNEGADVHGIGMGGDIGVDGSVGVTVPGQVEQRRPLAHSLYPVAEDVYMRVRAEEEMAVRSVPCQFPHHRSPQSLASLRVFLCTNY